MCALESLSAVMPVLHEEEVTELVVPTFIKACNDRIPNVQFCVARILKLRKGSFDQSIFNSQIVPVLKNMSHEVDKDVSYYATQALK